MPVLNTKSSGPSKAATKKAPKKMAKVFSELEDFFISGNYGNLSNDAIAMKLGCREDELAQRVIDLGIPLPKLDRLKGMSAHKINGKTTAVSMTGQASHDADVKSNMTMDGPAAFKKKHGADMATLYDE